MKWIFVIGISLTSLFADGAMIFEQQCAACHVSEKMSFEQMKSQRDRLKAPPISVVMQRLKKNINIVLDDEDVHKAVVVAFIKDYVMNPDIDKGLCHVNCFVHFGVMPSLKERISLSDLEMVANWAYDSY